MSSSRTWRLVRLGHLFFSAFFFFLIFFFSALFAASSTLSSLRSHYVQEGEPVSITAVLSRFRKASSRGRLPVVFGACSLCTNMIDTFLFLRRTFELDNITAFSQVSKRSLLCRRGCIVHETRASIEGSASAITCEAAVNLTGPLLLQRFVPLFIIVVCFEVQSRNNTTTRELVKLVKVLKKQVMPHHLQLQGNQKDTPRPSEGLRVRLVSCESDRPSLSPPSLFFDSSPCC